MNKTQKMAIAAAAVLLVAWTYSAQAGLDGATVNLSAYYPNSSSLFANGGNVVAPATYGTGFASSFSPGASAQVTDTQLIITQNLSATTYNPAAFDGWVLSIVSGATIVSASVDASSQVDPVSISIVGGDQLFLNYEGVTFPNGDSSIIDITTRASVPDGGLTLAMLGMAMTGLSFIRRKP